MTTPRAAELPALAGKVPFRALLILVPVICACSIWANLSFAIKDPVNFQFIPPFKPYANVNANGHLGGEYFQMAKALAAGKGFADPFDQPTGPTAWQPPVYPLLLAALLWVCEGSRDGVMAIVIFLQVYVLIATGLLVVALARRTTTHRLGGELALAIYLAVLLWNFKLCFQLTHDSWIVLLALDLIIAGLCWYRPLQRWQSASLWGLLGGFCALISPIAGFTWAMATLASAVGKGVGSRLVLTMLCAVLAVAPWTLRNYLVFGRLIPVKSNLAFEVFQSQCLQTDGLLTKFVLHPYRTNNSEGREYKKLGETAYLDRKWEQVFESVAADPLDFADRVAGRFLAATVWYVPFQGAERPWVVSLKRLTHPLPFLALLFLILTSAWKPGHWVQASVGAVYVFYLLPYVLTSYYERYALPLLGIKVLFCVWALDRILCWRTLEKVPERTAEALKRKEAKRAQQPAFSDN